MHRHRENLIVGILFLALNAGCDGCGGEVAPPVSPPRVRAAALDCSVVTSLGHSLGNAAVGDAGLVVTGPRGTLHFVSDPGVRTVDLSAARLGGIYEHQGVFYALEVGGDRVFSLQISEGEPVRGPVYRVGSGPRLMAFGPTLARVLSRDANLPIVDVMLETGQIVPVPPTGSVAADVEWFDGAFHEAWIEDGKVGSVPVEDEPYRLHATKTGLYVMHAGSATVSRVSDGRVVTLAGPPIRLDGDMVALVSGSGKVQLVRDMQVVATHEVPVGSNDLAVMEGVAVVSGGASGQIHLWSLEEGLTLSSDRVQVPFSVGRLYPWDRKLWVIGPKSGRVARCELK